MSPSKKWMSLVDEQLDDEYLEGVEKFLDHAFSHIMIPVVYERLRCRNLFDLEFSLQLINKKRDK
jgi:hypothetical protein